MRPRTRTAALVFSGLLLGVQGCTDSGVPAITVPPDVAPSHAQIYARGPAAPVARGIALALARPDLRRHVLEDMRDSPFPRHRLHLSSYLHGERGTRIVLAAAQALKMQSEEFLALLEGLPEMELHMARSYDRGLWTGTHDVVVAGSDRNWRTLYGVDGPQAYVTGYTTAGQELQIRADEYFKPPLLMIQPAEVSFGPDPEMKRRTAPKRSGNTISNREEELSIQSTCPTDPATGLPYENCEPDGSGVDPGGYWLSQSYSSCTTTAGHPDADQDGLRDDCEVEIVKAFAPMLKFDIGEQHWSRDPHWSAIRVTVNGVQMVQVFYLVAYHRDPGDPAFGTYAHDGDSEFLIVFVQDITGTGRWALTQMTYSAHWHQAWDRTHENLSYAEVEYVDTYRGRPRSWVSEGKHANYPNQGSCNGNFDDCANPQADTPLTPGWTLDTRNIGNRTLGVPLFTNPCATILSQPYSECFWTDDTFRGWQTENGGGAGGYTASLSWYLF